jgi:hypothetical protein
MRILTYKRTHVGDPDQYGRFGIYDCMGRVRSYAFDAVIGIGGIGQEPKSFGIDRKINWVGINPTRRPNAGGNGVEVTFEKFLRLEEHGPLLETLAPSLARRMYEGGARILLNNYSDREHREATAILKWSLNRKSRKVDGSKNARGCFSRCRPAVKSKSRGDVTQQSA